MFNHWKCIGNLKDHFFCYDANCDPWIAGAVRFRGSGSGVICRTATDEIRRSRTDKPLCVNLIKDELSRILNKSSLMRGSRPWQWATHWIHAVGYDSWLLLFSKQWMVAGRLRWLLIESGGMISVKRQRWYTSRGRWRDLVIGAGSQMAARLRDVCAGRPGCVGGTIFLTWGVPNQLVISNGIVLPDTIGLAAVSAIRHGRHTTDR